MSIGWSALTFTPDDEALAELRSSWSWRLKEPFVPLLFSTLGDMFFEKSAGDVYWLNTGTGEVTRIADNRDHFRELLAGEMADEWFLPPVVEKLHAAGKVPEPGSCYTFVTLPIFSEGTYSVDNLNVVPAKSHFGLTGHLHQQIAELPSGTKVQIKVTK